MKNLWIKKVALWVWVILTGLAMIGGVTVTQFLPLALVLSLIAFHLYGGKDLKIPIVVLSVIMVFVNLTLDSLLDVIAWVATAIVFAI